MHLKKSLIATCALALFSFAGEASAVTGGFVVPQASESAPGSANDFPFNTGGQRYQQVFDASLFSNFDRAHRFSAVAFRCNSPSCNVFNIFVNDDLVVDDKLTLQILDVRVTLSTTNSSSTSISNTFSENIGPDAKQVFSGDLFWTFDRNSVGLPDFNLIIDFSETFMYNASQGNLLMDILVAAQAAPNLNDMDGVSQSGMGRVWSEDGFPNALEGEVPDNFGLIAKFTVAPVPVPAALPLLLSSMGICAAISVRRRCNRRAATACP